MFSGWLDAVAPYRKGIVAIIGALSIILFDPAWVGLGAEAQGIFDQALAVLTALGVYQVPNSQ